MPGRRERQIPQVLQAGQDEIGAGAGAVAVTITPEELGEALLIGQVRVRERMPQSGDH